MDLTSQKQIKAVIVPIIEEAVSKTVDELLDKLQEILDDTVYANPAWVDTWFGIYGRTGEFRESWRTEVSGIIGNHCWAILEFDTGGIHHNGWIHGNDNPASSWYGAVDPIDFATWYNTGTTNSGYNFPTVPSYRYWDSFINYYNANLPNILAENCRKLGLDVI